MVPSDRPVSYTHLDVYKRQVRGFDGKQTLLDSLLGNGYALIGLSVDPTEGMSETFKQFLKQLGCQFITLYPYAERP